MPQHVALPWRGFRNERVGLQERIGIALTEQRLDRRGSHACGPGLRSAERPELRRRGITACQHQFVDRKRGGGTVTIVLGALKGGLAGGEDVHLTRQQRRGWNPFGGRDPLRGRAQHERIAEHLHAPWQRKRAVPLTCGHRERHCVDEPLKHLTRLHERRQIRLMHASHVGVGAGVKPTASDGLAIRGLLQREGVDQVKRDGSGEHRNVTRTSSVGGGGLAGHAKIEEVRVARGVHEQQIGVEAGEQSVAPRGQARFGADAFGHLKAGLAQTFGDAGQAVGGELLHVAVAVHRQQRGACQEQAAHGRVGAACCGAEDGARDREALSVRAATQRVGGGDGFTGLDGRHARQRRNAIGRKVWRGLQRHGAADGQGIQRVTHGLVRQLRGGEQLRDRGIQRAEGGGVHAVVRRAEVAVELHGQHAVTRGERRGGHEGRIGLGVGRDARGRHARGFHGLCG